MIGRSGERGSGVSVLAARHDDDDDKFGIYKFNWYLKVFVCISIHWYLLVSIIGIY